MTRSWPKAATQKNNEVGAPSPLEADQPKGADFIYNGPHHNEARKLGTIKLSLKPRIFRSRNELVAARAPLVKPAIEDPGSDMSS